MRPRRLVERGRLVFSRRKNTGGQRLRLAIRCPASSLVQLLRPGYNDKLHDIRREPGRARSKLYDRIHFARSRSDLLSPGKRSLGHCRPVLHIFVSGCELIRLVTNQSLTSFRFLASRSGGRFLVNSKRIRRADQRDFSFAADALPDRSQATRQNVRVVRRFRCAHRLIARFLDR
jgi:hypothetical protein